jgi:hypothetical protein
VGRTPLAAPPVAASAAAARAARAVATGGVAAGPAFLGGAGLSLTEAGSRRATLSAKEHIEEEVRCARFLFNHGAVGVQPRRR